MRTFIAASLLALSTPALGAWQLDNQDSSVSFISIKKTDIAEIHRFGQLSGVVSDSGKVDFAIDLTSVDTKVAIRDQRMRDYLFETTKFTKAGFSTQLDKNLLNNMAVGSTKSLILKGAIDLHGQQQKVTLDVMVAKLASNKVIIAAKSPMVLNASNFALADGVAKLQALAGLPSISKAVPLTFVLTFVDKT